MEMLAQLGTVLYWVGILVSALLALAGVAAHLGGGLLGGEVTMAEAIS